MLLTCVEVRGFLTQHVPWCHHNPSEHCLLCAGGVDAQHREAHAAFTASLEKVVSAHRGTPVQDRESVVAQLALQSSSAARLQRQTHLGTLNMASVEEEATDLTAAGALPLSQMAFKVDCAAFLPGGRGG
jgi:hypothetical protein